MRSSASTVKQTKMQNSERIFNQSFQELVHIFARIRFQSLKAVRAPILSKLSVGKQLLEYN